MSSGIILKGVDVMSKNLTILEVRKDVALKMYADTAAKKVEAYAKRNRPWTDRTSNARNTLNAKVERYGRNYRIALRHGMWYGVFLELAHEKKYAIIDPTIKAMSPEVMKGLQGLLDRIR